MMTQTYSIVILTKDRPDLLPRAVASACRACDTGGEIVVIDDASERPARLVLENGFDLEAERIRVLRRAESEGVSVARNLGLAAAQGRVIFFLDDDDALHPDYCARVLAGPALIADYGFSAYRVIGRNGTVSPKKPRFATGMIPPDAPLAKRLCGTGMGFWIRREVALAAGGFAPELTMNEDTDFVCRLIEQRRKAWYMAEPGVDIHLHDKPGNTGNITARVKAKDRAWAMRFVCDRHPQWLGHLGRSYLRHCAKAGLKRQAQGFIRDQGNLRLRLELALFFRFKSVASRVSRLMMFGMAGFLGA